MRFNSYFSSSKANLYEVIASSGKRLLIECGCTWKQLLKAIDHDLSNIAGCIISHSHNDHSKAIEDVMDNGIDVYSSEDTFNAIEESLHLHRRARVIRALERFYVGSEFIVMPFAVEHDVPCMGFVVHADHESLLFITDTMMIKQRFGCAFNIIAICCSYDGETIRDLVEAEKINETYAKRLISSHMEKNTTKSYIKDCCNLDKCTEIHLLHMSGSNIDKEKVRAELEKEFFIKTLIA
ncbi:MAG: MBL fold metallo-hydrolase [Planctomycetota bacterium]